MEFLTFHRGIPQLSVFLFTISTCFRCHALSLPVCRCRRGGCRCVAGAAAPTEAQSRKGLSSGESRGGQGAMDGYGYGEDLGGKRNTKPIPNIFP